MSNIRSMPRYAEFKEITSNMDKDDLLDVVFDCWRKGYKINPKTLKVYNDKMAEKKQLTERAPPGSQAEAWIKANKDSFKRQYGKNWERVLYATAWKRFGKNSLKEHADPRSYVNAWRGRGFQIDFEDYSPVGSKEVGKKFFVKYNDMSAEITEPKTGEYHLDSSDKVFPTFDKAMQELLNTTFKDKFVTEGNDLITIHHGDDFSGDFKDGMNYKDAARYLTRFPFGVLCNDVFEQYSFIFRTRNGDWKFFNRNGKEISSWNWTQDIKEIVEDMHGDNTSIKEFLNGFWYEPAAEFFPQLVPQTFTNTNEDGLEFFKRIITQK